MTVWVAAAHYCVSGHCCIAAPSVVHCTAAAAGNNAVLMLHDVVREVGRSTLSVCLVLA